MLAYEQDLWKRKLHYVAGVDEVGRGCLFGDVVAAAVILPKDLMIEGVNDSKKLSVKKRDELYDIIQEKALSIGVGKVDAAMIDKINIKQAARLAMKKAVEDLKQKPEYLLIDAEKIDCPLPQLAIIKGDALSQSIAAASIVAKVTRDRMCLQWDIDYPEYAIAIHKGYATKQHRENIVEYGACALHRKTFLSNIVNVQTELF